MVLYIDKVEFLVVNKNGMGTGFSKRLKSTARTS